MKVIQGKIKKLAEKKDLISENKEKTFADLELRVEKLEKELAELKKGKKGLKEE